MQSAIIAFGLKLCSIGRDPQSIINQKFLLLRLLQKTWEIFDFIILDKEFKIRMKWGYYDDMSHGDVCCFIDKTEPLPKREITNCNAKCAREATNMDWNATNIWAVVLTKHGSQTEMRKFTFFFLFCTLEVMKKCWF